MGCGSKMEIAVIDDIIDTKYQEGIKGILLGDDAFQGHLFPWYYTEDVTGAGDKDSQHRAALGHEYVYIDHDHDPVGKVISGFHNMFIPTVFCDITGQICAQLAIELCGSGLYMVIYSSITVFAALFRWYFYKKQLLCKQWIGVIIITIGLCITALGGKDVLNDDGDSSSSSTTNLGNDDGTIDER